MMPQGESTAHQQGISEPVGVSREPFIPRWKAGAFWLGSVTLDTRGVSMAGLTAAPFHLERYGIGLEQRPEDPPTRPGACSTPAAPAGLMAHISCSLAW